MKIDEFVEVLKKDIPKNYCNSNWYRLVDTDQENIASFSIEWKEAIFHDLGNMMGINPAEEYLDVCKVEIDIMLTRKLLAILWNYKPMLTIVDLDLDNIKCLTEHNNDDKTIVTTPNIIALLERVVEFKFDNIVDTNSGISMNIPCVTFENKNIFRDTLTKYDYIMYLNWDGKTPLVDCNLEDITANGETKKVNLFEYYQALLRGRKFKKAKELIQSQNFKS